MNDLERAQSILIICGLGAVARYLFGEGQFSPRALAANLTMAAFIGWGGVLVAEWLNLSAGQVGIITGALCWLGPTSVSIAAKKLIQQVAKYTEDKSGGPPSER